MNTPISFQITDLDNKSTVVINNVTECKKDILNNRVYIQGKIPNEDLHKISFIFEQEETVVVKGSEELKGNYYIHDYNKLFIELQQI